MTEATNTTVIVTNYYRFRIKASLNKVSVIIKKFNYGKFNNCGIQTWDISQKIHFTSHLHTGLSSQEMQLLKSLLAEKFLKREIKKLRNLVEK